MSSYLNRLRQQYSYLLRGGILITLMASVLVWLFTGADTLPVQVHQNYSWELGRLRQSDAELNAAVLASRLNLHRDFDSLAQTIDHIRLTLDTLEHIPDFLGDSDKKKLNDYVQEYKALQDTKVAVIDLYRREIAILRNSLSFFPTTIQVFIHDTAVPHKLSIDVGTFFSDMMTYVISSDPPLSQQIKMEHQSLARQTENIPPDQAAKLANLLSHAQVILERKHIIDAILPDLLALPTDRLGDETIRSYMTGYEHAVRKAHLHRVLLLLASLVLAGYLAIAIARLGEASHALAHANTDLKERISALRQAQEEVELYATVFTNAAEGMAIANANSRLIAINPAFSDITGYPPEEAINERLPLFDEVDSQSEGASREAMWKALKQRGQWHGELWTRRRSGEALPIWISVTLVHNANNHSIHYIGIFTDITERKKAEARIQHLANHDPLTNLPNRLLLQDRLTRAILQARHDKNRIAILFLDLDRFKSINDTLGHDAGDRLLVQVARRCTEAIRDTDTVARQGGDEFVIVLPALAHAQEATYIARKLLSALTAPFQLGEHAFAVSASIGIALYPNDGANESMLLRNADTAMYRAKAAGRNCFRFYSADMNTNSLSELLLENQLRGALKRDELRLYYQPKVDARTGQIIGAEALLRWQHPEFGLLPPNRFIPVAEESGLIVPAGEWVMYEACRQIRQWIDAGITPVPVAVNLSARQFLQQDIVALVYEALNEYGLPASLLELELTETMLMQDTQRAAKVLVQLRTMGIRLAIDDFGTGYSSLTYLHRFQVHLLKIDRSFVNCIGPHGRNGQIAAAIIALAHSLGQEVIAEGVENEHQREFLLRHQCNLFQGFLFGRPEAADIFEKRLLSRA